MILVKMENGWTWGDMYLGATEIEALLDSVTQDVCTIMDFSESPLVPPHALTHLKNINRQSRANQIKLAIVGLNIVGKSVINIFIRLYGSLAQGTDIKLVSTTEDAYKFFNIEPDGIQS